MFFSPSWLYFLNYLSDFSFGISAVSRKDNNYEATRLHFENLVKRYGNPIIILNLIKVNFFTFGVKHYIWINAFFFLKKKKLNLLSYEYGHL